jgi:hypothetical protein
MSFSKEKSLENDVCQQCVCWLKSNNYTVKVLMFDEPCCKKVDLHRGGILPSQQILH